MTTDLQTVEMVLQFNKAIELTEQMAKALRKLERRNRVLKVAVAVSTIVAIRNYINTAAK